MAPCQNQFPLARRLLLSPLRGISTDSSNYIFLNPWILPDIAWPSFLAQGPRKLFSSRAPPTDSKLSWAVFCGIKRISSSRVGDHLPVYWCAPLLTWFHSDDNLYFHSTDGAIHRRFATSPFSLCIRTEVSDDARIYLAGFSCTSRCIVCQIADSSAKDRQRNEAEDRCCH